MGQQAAAGISAGRERRAHPRRSRKLCVQRRPHHRLGQPGNAGSAADYYKAGKPVAGKLKTNRFEKPRQKHKAEHDDTLRLYYMAERKLKGKVEEGKLPIAAWRKEKADWEIEYKDLQQKLTPLYAGTKKLWTLHYSIHEVRHERERRNAVAQQKKQESEHSFSHKIRRCL